MHQSHIPQYTIQNRNVHISVLNGVLWDMGKVHCDICEIGLFMLSLVLSDWCCFSVEYCLRHIHVCGKADMYGTKTFLSHHVTLIFIVLSQFFMPICHARWGKITDCRDVQFTQNVCWDLWHKKSTFTWQNWHELKFWDPVMTYNLVVIGSSNGLLPTRSKPLPEWMLSYCQIANQEQTSVKFESKYKILHSMKCIQICPFCSHLNLCFIWIFSLSFIMPCI